MLPNAWVSCKPLKMLPELMKTLCHTLKVVSRTNCSVAFISSVFFFFLLQTHIKQGSCQKHASSSVVLWHHLTLGRRLIETLSQQWRWQTQLEPFISHCQLSWDPSVTTTRTRINTCQKWQKKLHCYFLFPSGTNNDGSKLFPSTSTSV